MVPVMRTHESLTMCIHCLFSFPLSLFFVVAKISHLPVSE